MALARLRDFEVLLFGAADKESTIKWQQATAGKGFSLFHLLTQSVNQSLTHLLAHSLTHYHVTRTQRSTYHHEKKERDVFFYSNEESKIDYLSVPNYMRYNVWLYLPSLYSAILCCPDLVSALITFRTSSSVLHVRRISWANQTPSHVHSTRSYM